MPIFYLSGESPPSTFPLQFGQLFIFIFVMHFIFGQLFIFIFVIHFTKSKLITRSVPVLKLPKKMHYSLFQKYKSATKKSGICRKYRHKIICINNTQLTTFYYYSATSSIKNLSNNLSNLFFTSFKRGYHPIVYPISTLIPSPL